MNFFKRDYGFSMVKENNVRFPHCCGILLDIGE